MRRLETLIIATSLTFAALPAAASCWSNKAICQAICGLDCCSGASFAAPSNQRALSQISVKALQSELDGMDKSRENKAFMDAVTREINQRSGGTGTIRKSD